MNPHTHTHTHTQTHTHTHAGRIHFVKFETARIADCLDFIEAKGLHRCLGRDGFQHEMRVKATGGGAHRFADMFKERLGLVIEKEDEISCAVGGCNFLLRAISHEAFTFTSGQSNFLTFPSDSDLYPYLLVNIGSGVSIIKVDGDGQFTRISGSSVGGGTFWGLCSLLTGERDFDKILALSATGNNATVDMLVGDIYGGRDYASIGLSATTIASSFGKVVGADKALADYNKADIAMALCRMISYNIGQLAYMNAKRFGLKRVFFGGFFIRGHPYTMDTISFAIRFWSQGEINALFLRHEGFLGAVGAFLKVHPMQLSNIPGSALGSRPNSGNRGTARSHRSKVRARFVERFSMGAPFAGGEVHGPAIRDMSDRVSWVEKFVAAGTQAHEAATEQRRMMPPMDLALDRTTSSASAGPEPPSPAALGLGYPANMALHVGVLHYSPTWEPFPLLADFSSYEPDTVDINADEVEYSWLLKVLQDQIPTVVEKAIASEGGGDGPRRRATAFARAFAAHLAKLRAEPGCYGQLGLGELFEMREECLREFGFSDVYRLDKERENAVALQVLPDLLTELDSLPPRRRLLSIVQGILAANIFDWGARACVDLYMNGTILDIYREARRKLANRPWRVDDFDAFCERVYGPGGLEADDAPAAAAAAAGTSPAAPAAGTIPAITTPAAAPPFRRVMIFVDNAGADVVLGMLPFLRELLRLGCEVVLVANSLPAINDITAPELRSLLSAAAEVCPIIKAARQAGKRARLFVVGSGNGGPCLDLRRVPAALADAAAGVDLLVIEGMGRAVHTNLTARFKCDSLKLAMIKTERLAKKLFGGSLYDCVCRYQAGARAGGEASAPPSPPLPPHQQQQQQQQQQQAAAAAATPGAQQ
ncbi:MAG: fumble-domain-containing protein [Monoraphidium minutum]|nr:MAG: fumble-domain-containing protein [Monoraphidium minutum]